MQRRRFLQAILDVIGLTVPQAAIGETATGRVIPLQISPVAGFQYHCGEALWAWLCPGQTLDLRRERDNPYDKDAVRVEWLGDKLGYVPRDENHVVAQLLDRGEKLSARVTALDDSANPRERVRFAVLLQAWVRMGLSDESKE